MAICILIVSAAQDDVAVLKRALERARDGPFAVSAVETLHAAICRLDEGGIDAVLVDLHLPDSDGLSTFARLHGVASHTPILVVCGSENEEDAIAAVQQGAQGYLSKGFFDNYLVPQSLRNIVQRKAAEERLYLAQARAEITLNSIGDAVISTDLHGVVDYLNVAAERMTGWTRAAAAGLPIDTVLRHVDGESGKPLHNPLYTVLQSAPPVSLQDNTLLLRRDGVRIPIEDSAAPILDWDGRTVGAVLVFRDISHTVALTAHMRHLAQHDALTNLPNRVLLNDRIEQAIALARRHGTHLAVLFLDLDRFKHINDSLGHAVGDQVLQSVAQRLVACVRTSDTVSRQGGDEFVILLAEDRRPADAALAADKVLAALAAPHRIAGHVLHISTSIGISVFPDDSHDADSLIKNADTAMYHAKERGRNSYQFFRDDMNAQAVRRQAIEHDLRSAIAQGQFALFYQPKVALDTGRITGVEALLRWRHPQQGLLLPSHFIGVAEDSGLIIPIGRWVWEEACAQAARWRQMGIGPISVAVNVSALEFRHTAWFGHTCDILGASGANPADLQLELTETVLMRDVEASAQMLARLKGLGVQIAVDDFGTGYSSLSYLSQFPIDVLKIDQSFVHAIDGAASNSSVIVSAVIGMGNSLRQRVIAEGVEDARQLAFLRARHCDEAQGYWFSRPVDAVQMEAMLLAAPAGRGA